MLGGTFLVQGTLLMWLLSGLHYKGGASVKCQHLLHCHISEYSLANWRPMVVLLFSVQAAEVRTLYMEESSPGQGRQLTLAVAVLCVLSQLHQTPLRYLPS